jgi:hypothetical protein
MIFKFVNDLVDSNKLILILLVFETYSRIIELDVLSIITKKVVVMRKIIKKIQKKIAER